MKLSEAIYAADQLRPNSVAEETKRRWLWQLDCEFAEMMGTSAPAYAETDDPEMLMPDPHSNCYPIYLAAYIDYCQEETGLYQMDTVMANQALDAARRWWMRTHKRSSTLSGKIKGVFD